MIVVERLSKQYEVRQLNKEDVSLVLKLQQGHPVYYEYCPPAPSVQSILLEMKALPLHKKT
ncbi:MAG: hypothetical protein ACOX1F_01575 [Erysipelotrichaceae bacterium]|jgi:hypothetical protein